MSRPYEKKAYMATLRFDTLLTDDEIEALKTMPGDKVVEFILSNAVPETMYGSYPNSVCGNREDDPYCVDFENLILEF